MTLLIDLGNTALKWAVMDAGLVGRAVVEVHRGADDLEARLAAAWRAQVGAFALGCSVAASGARDQVDRAAARCGVSVRWLTAEEKHAGTVVLTNGYREPGQLGADRWHGMLGASERRPRQSFVLIAAGTATTVDCVEWTDPGARFVGGCIAPGARMMMEALATRTAGLPHARGRPVDFPDNTDDAIATGVADAQAGLAAGLIRRFMQRIGCAPSILISGGDAEAVADRLRVGGIESAIEHNLVLAGLALRARSINVRA